MPAAEWHGGDLIASTDALVAKAGYGTVCEAMAAARRSSIPPGGASPSSAPSTAHSAPGAAAVPVSARAFSSFKLDRALDRALNLGTLTPPYPTDGAARVADHLAGLC